MASRLGPQGRPAKRMPSSCHGAGPAKPLFDKANQETSNVRVFWEVLPVSTHPALAVTICHMPFRFLPSCVISALKNKEVRDEHPISVVYVETNLGLFARFEIRLSPESISHNA